MKLSLFWKLMLAFALVVAVGFGAVVILANQITSREFHQMMMGYDISGMMPGMMSGRGPATMQQAALDRVNQAVLFGGVIALIAALIVGYFVFRAITRPMEQLTSAAQQLAAGHLGARVAVDDHHARLGPDEISELGAAFNTRLSSHGGRGAHTRNKHSERCRRNSAHSGS